MCLYNQEYPLQWPGVHCAFLLLPVQLMTWFNAQDLVSLLFLLWWLSQCFFLGLNIGIISCIILLDFLHWNYYWDHCKSTCNCKKHYRENPCTYCPFNVLITLYKAIVISYLHNDIGTEAIHQSYSDFCRFACTHLHFYVKVCLCV